MSDVIPNPFTHCCGNGEEYEAVRTSPLSLPFISESFIDLLKEGSQLGHGKPARTFRGLDSQELATSSKSTLSGSKVQKCSNANVGALSRERPG